MESIRDDPDGPDTIVFLAFIAVANAEGDMSHHKSEWHSAYVAMECVHTIPYKKKIYQKKEEKRNTKDNDDGNF